MKRITAALFSMLAQSFPDFRGKVRLLRALGILCRGMPVRSRYGVRFVCDFGDYTNRAAIMGWYGTAVADVVKELKPGDAFVDIGANAGLFSVLAARQVGVDGVVVSFEPQSTVSIRLRQNCMCNKVYNVVIFELAVGTATRRVGLSPLNDKHSGSVYIENEQPGRMTWQVNVDEDLSLIWRMVGSREMIIKVDVEGAEYIALEAVRSLLVAENVRKVIVEIDDKNLERFSSSRDAIYSLMSSMQYKPWLGKHSSRGHYDEIFTKTVI